MIIDQLRSYNPHDATARALMEQAATEIAHLETDRAELRKLIELQRVAMGDLKTRLSQATRLAAALQTEGEERNKTIQSLRTVLQWYADPSHWIDAVVLSGEETKGIEVTGDLIGRGKMPGEFGLMPGCRCGQCWDYWHADNGGRAAREVGENGK